MNLPMASGRRLFNSIGVAVSSAALLFIGLPTSSLALGLTLPRLTIHKGVKVGNVEVDGNAERFLAENKTINGLRLKLGSAVLQTLKAEVDGEFAKGFTIKGSFDDTLYPSKRELTLTYGTPTFTIQGGDIATKFKGADLPLNFRTLFGARVRASDNTRSKEFTAFAAQLTTKHGVDEFLGDDTIGPFFLSKYPLIQNSEIIEVDEERQYQFSDYELDAERGTVLFKRPIEAGRRIRITYEHDRDFGVRDNRLAGARVTGRFGKGRNAGVTFASMDESKSLGTRVIDLDHRVFGFDVNFDTRKVGKFRLEMAKSEDNREDLDSDGRQDMVEGIATAGSYNFQNWLMSVAAKFERTEPGFKTVAESVSDNDRQIFDVKTTIARNRASQLSMDYRNTRDNLARDPSRADGRGEKFEARFVNKGTLKGKGYEFTLRRRDEHRYDAGTLSTRDNTDITSSADFLLRLRGVLAGLKLERRANEDRKTVDRGTVSDSGEISFKVRVAEPVITSVALKMASVRAGLDGRKLNDEITGTLGVDSKLAKWLRGRIDYLLRDRSGTVGGRDESASVSVKTVELLKLSADLKYEVKRTKGSIGGVTGSALAGGGITWRADSRFEARAYFERRGIDGSTGEDRNDYGLETIFRPRKNWTLKGELRNSDLIDSSDPLGGYDARTAYLEAEVTF